MGPENGSNTLVSGMSLGITVCSNSSYRWDLSNLPIAIHTCSIADMLYELLQLFPNLLSSKVNHKTHTVIQKPVTGTRDHTCMFNRTCYVTGNVSVLNQAVLRQ